MNVRWTDTAILHLIGLVEHLVQDSPVYGQRILERIITSSEQIAEFPYSGRSVPEYDSTDIRELFEPPFRLIYRVNPERADILAVIHSRRTLPTDL